MTPEKPWGVIIKEGDNMCLTRFWIVCVCVFLYVVLVCLEFGRHMFLISDAFFPSPVFQIPCEYQKAFRGSKQLQGICKILED